MSDERDNRGRLSRMAVDLGFSFFGVADVSGIREEFHLREETRRKFDRALSLGKRLLDAVMDDIADQPTPLYFHHYRQINFFLDRGALRLASAIQDMGFSALPIPASQILDWEQQRGHLSHKAVGRLAGLGWIGRNNLLVHPSLGSRLRLVTVLTDMPLEADKPLEADCGGCRRCLAVCPAGAIAGTPADFDHLACYEKLKDFRRRKIVTQFICGVCVRACGAAAAREAAGLKPEPDGRAA